MEESEMGFVMVTEERQEELDLEAILHWLGGLEGYTIRVERFIEDVRVAQVAQLKRWMAAAYRVGYDAAVADMKAVTVLEVGEGLPPKSFSPLEEAWTSSFPPPPEPIAQATSAGTLADATVAEVETTPPFELSPETKAILERASKEAGESDDDEIPF